MADPTKKAPLEERGLGLIVHERRLSDTLNLVQRYTAIFRATSISVYNPRNGGVSGIMGKAGRERHDAAGSVQKPVNILTPVRQRVKTPMQNHVFSPHQTPPFAHGHFASRMNDAVGNICATVVNVHGEKLKGKFDNPTVAG